MPELSLQEIIRITGGTASSHPREGEIRFSDYSFDTRQTHERTLFFALRTPESDGHLYLDQLRGIPGVGAVVRGDYRDPGLGIPLVRVEEPLEAAQRLARYVREQLRHVRYVGVTGSAGKTTTKEFIYQILASRFSAYRSPLNWNNHLGLPFSLLKLEAGTEAAVFEIAMSDPGLGEIDRLTSILRPDVACVLNVYPVHLEFLKTQENVAQAKTEVLNYLEADDVALLSGDFDLLRQQVEGRAGHIVFFGSRPEHNHIVLRDVVRRGNESDLLIDFYGISQRFSCQLMNRLHLENLFAAIVVCHSLGLKHIEIQEALSRLQPLAGRGIVRAVAGFSVIDETYNSNPEALKKTLSWVDAEFRGAKVAVLGDMLELGTGEEMYHRQVGEFLAGLDYLLLVTVGERGHWIAEGAQQAGFDPGRIRSFATAAEAGSCLRREAPADSVILFKGSRGMQLERAIEELAHG